MFLSSLVLILALSAPVSAAQEIVGDPYPLRTADTSSPRDTLQSFQKNVDQVAKAWRQNKIDSRAFRRFVNAGEALDFSTTPQSEAFSVKIERMLFLKEILDRIELPPASKIPGDDEVRRGDVTRWSIPNTQITIARIESGPRAGEFLFSAATVQRLDAYYRLAKHLPYKSTANSPGAYEVYVASKGMEFERRLRNRLKRVDTSSPRSTLVGFLESVHQAYTLVMDANAKLAASPPKMTSKQALDIERRADNSLVRAIDTLDLSRVPDVHREDFGLEAALQLKEVLDRTPLPFLDSVPNAEMVEAARERVSGSSSPVRQAYRWRYPNTEIEIVEVTAGERQGAFLFSADTVRRAGEFYRKVRELPYRGELVTAAAFSKYSWSDESKGFYDYYISTPGHLIAEARLFGRLINHLPAWFKTRVGEQVIWQWIALFVCALGTAAAGVAVFRLTKKSVGRLKSPLDRWLVLLAPLLVALIVKWTLQVLDSEVSITGTALQNARAFGETIVTALVVWSVIRLCRAIAETLVASPQVRDLRIDASLVRIGMSIISFLAGGLIIIYSLRQLGTDMVPVLAGLGVGGLAVALAAQRTFANFIGSLILFANKPVRVGDFCRYGDEIGTVEYIGLLSTRIRSLERTLVTVPNAELSEMKLDNFSKRDMRLLKTVLQLRYETTPEQMRYILAKLREMLLGHPKVMPAPARVRFIGYGAYSKDLEVFAYLDCQDQDTFLAMQEDVLLRMEDIIAEAGSGFAFPSQTTYHSRDTGLDAERQAEAEAHVGEWREHARLPFPDFAEQERERLEGVLDYPPKGSPQYALPEAFDHQRPAGDAWMFSVEDLTNLPSLVAKLRGNDRLATHLLGRLSEETRKLLSAYEGGTDSALKDALVRDLNAIIHGPLIYEAKRFSHVTQSAETQELIARNPRGEELQRLNRLLLQDAYPAELWRHTRTAMQS